jgi:hypothetical protein
LFSVIPDFINHQTNKKNHTQIGGKLAKPFKDNQEYTVVSKEHKYYERMFVL